MAPNRARATHDEPKVDAQGRDRHTTHSAASTKHKKTHANHGSGSTASKNTSGAQLSSQPPQQAQQPEVVGISWQAEKVSTLQAYRHAYNLPSPAAFHSPYNAAVLKGPGIGHQSPTMARKKDKRYVGKDQLANTVRKHFNSLAVNETDVVVEFLYAVKNQDKNFKVRLAPSKKSGST